MAQSIGELVAGGYSFTAHAELRRIAGETGTADQMFLPASEQDPAAQQLVVSVLGGCSVRLATVGVTPQ